MGHLISQDLILKDKVIDGYKITDYKNDLVTLKPESMTGLIIFSFLYSILGIPLGILGIIFTITSNPLLGISCIALAYFCLWGAIKSWDEHTIIINKKNNLISFYNTLTKKTKTLNLGKFLSIKLSHRHFHRVGHYYFVTIICEEEKRGLLTSHKYGVAKKISSVLSEFLEIKLEIDKKLEGNPPRDKMTKSEKVITTLLVLLVLAYFVIKYIL